MVKENLLEHKRLEVKVTNEPDSYILSLLESSVIGAEGGMQYSMQDIPEKIRAYGKSLSFLSLYKKDNLTGVIGLCRRDTTTAGKVYDSTYVRYLSFRSAFQAEVPTGVTNRDHSAHLRESFKQKVFSMFSRPWFLPEKQEGDSVKHVMYAYVESKNERSKNLINQAGYEYIRSFLTIAFSRFNPKPDRRVTRLSTGEVPAMRGLLKDYYKEHSFYTDEFSFFNDGYYVLKEDNTIVAGVCVIPTKYKVVNMPGVWGWLLMKIMPYLPYFRRLFRPGEFRYLVLSALYCQKGKEHLLPDLFEDVCAEEGFHTALTWLDDHSDLYEKLHTSRMGALNRILNAKPGLVYASFINIDADERDKFYDAPVYISGFDFS